MRAFIIHRTSLRVDAQRFFASLKKTHGIYIDPFFLKKSYGDKWKAQAENYMYSAEVVIIFDVDSCLQSDNTIWEIEQAKKLDKKIIELTREKISSRDVGDLQSAYEFSSEFSACFKKNGNDSDSILELYKVMVSSSEQLIQRRQITNGFFITIIGTVIGASGFVIKEKLITDDTILVLVFPAVIGLLMCRSWKNLIDNYGKLNSGKFKVINEIEKSFDVRIFSAEWIALGKGLRKEKYQSFTSTEKNVPVLFSFLLWFLLVFALLFANWHDVAIDFETKLKGFIVFIDAIKTYFSTVNLHV